MCSEWGQFEKSSTWVNDSLNALTWQVFSTGPMSVNVFSTAAFRGFGQTCSQFLNQGQVVGFPLRKLRVSTINPCW
jgi:hypothetical protein